MIDIKISELRSEQDILEKRIFQELTFFQQKTGVFVSEIKIVFPEPDKQGFSTDAYVVTTIDLMKP